MIALLCYDQCIIVCSLVRAIQACNQNCADMGQNDHCGSKVYLLTYVDSQNGQPETRKVLKEKQANVEAKAQASSKCNRTQINK
jgi:hypothetical protein